VGTRAGLDDGKSRLHRDSIPDRTARSQSLYRLSYPAHKLYEMQLLDVETSSATLKHYGPEEAQMVPAI